jgi:uncharacterized membrane protein YfcA
VIDSEFLLYLGAGAVAGLMSGLFGVGGGIVIVPILSFLFIGLHFPEMHLMHLALGTSLASIILTSISSARAHHRNGNVNWLVVRQITPAVVIGTLLGTLVAAQLHSVWLKAIIAVFELCVATQLLLNLNPNPHRNLPGRVGIGVAGGMIGIVSSLVGIGGGTLSVPYLIYCNFDTRHAIGTSAAVGLPIAAAGTLGYLITGWHNKSLPQPSLGFIYLPAFAGIAIASIITAPLGATLAQRLPILTLKRLFALLLYIVGLKMIWGLL